MNTLSGTKSTPGLCAILAQFRTLSSVMQLGSEIDIEDAHVEVVLACHATVTCLTFANTPQSTFRVAAS